MDPLLYIERGLEYQYRKDWGRLLFVWSVLFLSLAMTSFALGLPPIFEMSFEVLFLLFLAIYLANAIMKAVFLHHYKERIVKGRGKTYEVLVAEESARRYGDDVSGFLDSFYGDETMRRLGIKRPSIQSYIEKRRFGERFDLGAFKNQKIDLPIYALLLHDSDPHFAAYLRSQRILRDDLAHAARLVQNISALQKEYDRIWSRTQLHDLSPFEQDILNIEEAHDIYFTSPVLRKMSLLDDDEKLHILKKIITNAKKEKRKDISIGDIHPDRLGIMA